MRSLSYSHPRLGVAVAASVLSLAACAHGASTATIADGASRTTARAATSATLLPGPVPAPLASAWRGLLGEYDVHGAERIVLERDGQLILSDTAGNGATLTPRSDDAFVIPAADARRLLGAPMSDVGFVRDADGRATVLTAGADRFTRRAIEPRPGTNQLQVTPLRPVAELRAEALAASPPHEDGTFRAPDLVELTSLDPSIKLEIRYATTNNFLGTRFYDQPRAFMQRPAAEAVVRASRALRPLGYGLLVHDAYRPWYVTKMFWDATPADKKWLVANPASGSKHNRGCAVDLTLYDLVTGRPVEMPSTYDESTDRAYANYVGGTSQERWRRLLLRRAMVAQGFEINPTEWWHFDFDEWRNYAIGNVTFDRIGR